MPRTFVNSLSKRPYKVNTDRGVYIMHECWIDTTCSSDMMDYDFTAPINELKEMHERFRLWQM